MSNWIRKAMTPLKKLRNLALNIRRLGLLDTLDLYKYRIYESYRDWRLGIHTGGFIDSNQLGHDADCSDHEAMNYRCLDIALKHLQPEPGKEVFLDYGCGKGRVVVTAARYPFRRVIGIELSAPLSDIARENVRLASKKFRCQHVDIFTADATQWEVPEEVTVAFFFNPFTGRILEEVQQRLRESLENNPRPLKIIYMRPAKQSDAFAKCDWLTKLCDLPTADWDEVKFAVYESRWNSLECRAVAVAAENS